MCRDDMSKRPRDPMEVGMQAAIGDQLRSMYESVLSEPIPERLVELLEKLDQASQNNRSVSKKETE